MPEHWNGMFCALVEESGGLPMIMYLSLMVCSRATRHYDRDDRGCAIQVGDCTHWKAGECITHKAERTHLSLAGVTCTNKAIVANSEISGASKQRACGPGAPFFRVTDTRIPLLPPTAHYTAPTPPSENHYKSTL